MDRFSIIALIGLLTFFSACLEDAQQQLLGRESDGATVTKVTVTTTTVDKLKITEPINEGAPNNAKSPGLVEPLLPDPMDLDGDGVPEPYDMDPTNASIGAIPGYADIMRTRGRPGDFDGDGTADEIDLDPGDPTVTDSIYDIPKEHRPKI